MPGIGGAGIHQEGFVQLAGAAGQGWSGTYYKSFTRDEKEDAPADVRAYLKKMEDRYGAKLSKTMYIAALWDDTIRLVVDAAKRAKSTGGDDIKAALEGTQVSRAWSLIFPLAPASMTLWTPNRWHLPT